MIIHLIPDSSKLFGTSIYRLNFFTIFFGLIIFFGSFSTSNANTTIDDAFIELQEQIAKSYTDRRNYQLNLQKALSQAMYEDPYTPLPTYNDYAGVTYEKTSKYILNKIAKGNYRSLEETSAAIDNNPVLALLFKNTPDMKSLAANAVFTRVSEKFASHKTYSSWLDEDPRYSVREANTADRSLSGIKSVDNFLFGTYDSIISLKEIPLEILGLTEIAKNHKAQDELTFRMNCFSKDTITGMQKYYALEEFKQQRNELTNYDRQNSNLELIDSKIKGIMDSFSQEELEAIKRHGAEYDRYKIERDSLVQTDPENFRPRYTSDVEHERERAAIKMHHLFTMGNADFLNLDNLAYTSDIVLSYFTSDQLAYFFGRMIPYLIIFGVLLFLLKKLLNCSVVSRLTNSDLPEDSNK